MRKTWDYGSIKFISFKKVGEDEKRYPLNTHTTLYMKQNYDFI